MRAVIMGASGGIGGALTHKLAMRDEVAQIYALSRSTRECDGPKTTSLSIDLLDEASIAQAATAIGADGPLDLVIIASGTLTDGAAFKPEKSLKQQDLAAFERIFAINTIGPALVAKHFIPLMPRSGRAVFAALSARVGSISDNQIGGWHAYRASKAALNMLIRNYAIEQARRNQGFIAVGLHPGTVDTNLSRPFQSSVPDKQLFSPKQSAGYLLNVIDQLSPSDSGKVLDWDGKQIEA